MKQKTGYRLIEYNMHRLDGTFWNDSRDTAFPPIEWRHDVIATAAHELGHALLLNHNPTCHHSLMRETSAEAVYIWGTQGPTAQDDLPPVRRAY